MPRHISDLSTSYGSLFWTFFLNHIYNLYNTQQIPFARSKFSHGLIKTTTLSLLLSSSVTSCSWKWGAFWRCTFVEAWFEASHHYGFFFSQHITGDLPGSVHANKKIGLPFNECFTFHSLVEITRWHKCAIQLIAPSINSAPQIRCLQIAQIFTGTKKEKRN